METKELIVKPVIPNKGTDRPALKYLNRYVRADIATKWHDVGVELLDVEDEPALDAIKVNSPGDVDKCTAEMLQLWLKRKPDASWNQLIEAFRAPNIKLEALASKIEGMLSKERALVPSSTEALMLFEKIEGNKCREDFATIDKLKDENVVGAFTYLFSKLMILLSKADFDELKSVCMLRGAPLPQQFKRQMRAAQEMDDIFDVLDNPLYCNWLNVRLLKRIAKNIENRQAVELIKIYEENVYSRKVSDVKQYFSICFDEKTVSQIEVKINKIHEDLTVKEIFKSCKELDKIMDIYTGAVSVTGSSAGCLKITIVIPLHCSLHAFKTVKRNTLKLRQFHIQYLEIESFPKLFAVNYPDNDNTLVSLSSDIPIFSDPSQVVNYYYICLESHMDADSVSHMMHYKHLITDDDYEAITAAPNDSKMNTVILQYVRAMDMNQLNKFCDVLKSIETQKNIGDCLSTALETVLKNSSIDSKDQTAYEDLSQIHLMFFDLVDKLMLLLSAMEKLPFDLFNLCHDLNACDSIPLFTAKCLERFSNCKSIFCFKTSLLPFITWLDHSILNELVAATGNDNAKQLLDQFDCKIDKSKSVTSYPIPTPNQLMIPLDDSEYTILAVKLYNYHKDITLYRVEEVKLLMARSLKVSNHVFQLLAIHNKASYLYWMIPKCVVSSIQHNLKSNHELLQNSLIISILPDGLFADENVQEKLKGPFSLLYSQAHEYIEHDDAQEYHKSLQETVDHLETNKIALEGKIQDLTSELQVQRTLNKSTGKLSEKTTNIRLEKAQLKRERDKLQLELETLKEKIDELNEDNKQLIFELQKIIGKEEAQLKICTMLVATDKDKTPSDSTPLFAEGTTTSNCDKGMVNIAVFAEVKKVICCIESPVMTGTGFIGYVKCSKEKYYTVLVTTNHIIKTFDDAMGSEIIFKNAFPDRSITVKGSKICVKNSFWHSPFKELDYVLIEINEDKLVDPQTNKSLDINPIQLIRLADFQECDQIYVLQYSPGEQLAFSSSDSIVLHPLLLYQHTTGYVPSGSPVFKEVDGELKVVALHRGGQETEVNYFGYNCGTLMCEIVNHLNGKPAPPLPTNKDAQEAMRKLNLRNSTTEIL